MNDLTDTLQKLENFFQRVDNEKAATQAAHNYISHTLDHALANEDIDLLLSLISYIESGDGILSYKYIAETRRILRTLHIIELERKYHQKLFSTHCIDKGSLMEKYMLSLFAFRRLLFHLSDASVNEAVSYLLQNQLSVFAVYTIIQEDLIIPERLLYEKIAEIYADFWNNDDIWLLNSLINSNEAIQ